MNKSSILIFSEYNNILIIYKNQSFLLYLILLQIKKKYKYFQKKITLILFIIIYLKLLKIFTYKMEQISNKETILKQFLEKNKNEIANNVNLNNIKCEILTTSEEDLQKAGQYIREGRLVAFPTETVYGLGANALIPEAVKSIFLTKRRPLSDPVIVHITNKDKIKDLTIFDSEQQISLFNNLTDKLWPGPLTTIIKANFNVLDRIVTAQTDFVGIRIPKSEVAQKLINYSKVPITAPSANLFAHVSPTKAIHVFNDFYDQDIAIIDGPSCQCGIESTVMKIVSGQQINILRLGSLSETYLQQIINEQNQNIEVNMITKKKAKEGENQEAPGQALKHYSPNIESYMLVIQQQELETNQLSNLKKKLSDNFECLNKQSNILIENSLILDFKGLARNLKDKCKIYMEMGPSDCKDFSVVMNNLYDLLRVAENKQGISHILIVYLKKTEQQLENMEFFQTVYDKIYRCTSGKKIVYVEGDYQLYSL